MKIFDDLFLLERLDWLIRTKSTGTPIALANRLNTSECTVYRLIGRLKDQGFPIAYDKENHTYFYTEFVKINMTINVGEDEILKITGG
jgi:predicted DNA-binding transcriptional regulator YafY